MKPCRSLLFIPGNQQRMLDKGPTTGADALLVDLEDAVPVAEKETARAMVRDYISTLGGRPVWVRTNAVASGLTHADLESVLQPGLHGVLLSKVESTDEVRQVSSWLDELELGAGVERGQTEIICMLESAVAVRLAYEIATASTRVASLCFGCGENGDFQTDIGCDWSVEGTEMLYARSKVVLDARAAGIEYPLDGIFADIDNLDALAAETLLSKRLGYKGRTIIHPKHVETVNAIYTPSAEEIAYYRGLLEAFEAAVSSGNAAASYKGKMIDYAMAGRARRVLAVAQEIESAS